MDKDNQTSFLHMQDGESELGFIWRLGEAKADGT